MSSPSVSWRSDTLFCAAVLFIAFLCYWPALSGGFIWDDSALLTANAQVQAPGGLYSMWFTNEGVDYWPVTETSFWLEWRLWHMTSTGYHVTNVLLLVMSALVFWRVLQGLSLPAAKLASVIFLVHPMNVESVAWIAQRKNTLSLALCLVSLLWYVHGERARMTRHRWPATIYVGSLLAFALAMLSKGAVAILPGVLFVLIWWRRNKITSADVARLVPFVIIAAGLTLLNVFMQTRRSATPFRTASFVERMLGAAAVVWFYLAKAIVPAHLMFVYPQWSIDTRSILWWIPLLAMVAVSAILLLTRQVRTVRGLLVAWICFCLALVPVMGLVDVYYMRYSLVADHYAYLGLLVVAAAGAAGLENALSAVGAEIAGAWRGGVRPALLKVVAAGVVTALAVATWRQAGTYQSADALYAATLRSNPSCWLCEVNLSVPLIARGTSQDLNDALAHLTTAARLRPNAPEIHDGLGVVLQKLGRPREAVVEEERAATLNPHSADAQAHLALAYETLGRTLVTDGQFAAAVTAFRRAISHDRQRPVSHRELGYALLQLGDAQGALSELNEALRLDPSSAAAHDTLGAYWRSVHRPQEALAEYRRAAQLEPNVAGWHVNVGSALLEQGDLPSAAAAFREAIRCDPGLAVSHRNLGVALAQMGRFDEAMQQLTDALRLDPHDGDAAADLAEVRKMAAVQR